MAELALFLLGPPRLERDGVPLQFDTHKIMALVAYLAMADLADRGTRITRESLVTLLWPELEPSRARGVLRRNLSLLRKALEGEWLVADRQTVSLDPGATFWFDVGHFASLVRTADEHSHPQDPNCPQCLEALAGATALCRGEFMEGFGLRDSVAYDDWQFFQAEGLRQQWALALERLARGYGAAGDYEAALTYARQWLALDSLHEPAHRQLMRLYALSGRRSAALRQYHECARILDQEMGLAPDDETIALYEQIRTAPVPEPGSRAVPEQAEGADLLAWAPPPRHNLPAQTTPFVGREEEVAEVGARLLDPTCRLLTLLGPGGIGKTRLALQIAHTLAGADQAPFEHGVFFVPLAAIQAAEGIVPAVAEAVGYCCRAEGEGTPGPAPKQQMLDYLSGKRLLLVMDNYEQLLVDGVQLDHGDGADDGNHGLSFLSEVLASAPGVKFLVTSRASLRVRGEHLYPLAGLRAPEPTLDSGLDPDHALNAYSSVELFVQGARRVRPDFELRPQDLAHVARICRLVQGMPLAILLAAAWVEMLAPQEIATEIQRSLDFLETDLRDVPPRQRSIRAAFDPSWQLLDARERETFQGLSVFRGGFTREAAQQVTGASLRDLMSLINKSLLLPTFGGRYELHELLRQYGSERLETAEQKEHEIRERHCAFYVAALEQWGRELKGASQREAASEMDLEIENVRAAWHRAIEQGQVDRLARGAEAMWLYLAQRLRYEEGEAAFRIAAGRLAEIDSFDAQRLRVTCLILWSHFLLDQGKRQRSVEVARQAQGLLEDLEQAGHNMGRERALATFHQSRITHYYDPDPRRARQSYEISAEQYEQVGDRWGLARALAHLGWMAEHMGDYGEARQLCEKSLAIRRELGDQAGMADSMLKLGIVSWVQGRLDEAEELLRESLGIFRLLDDWNGLAHAVKTMGEVLVRRGRFADGLALMESSASIYEDFGHKFGVAGLLPFQGEAKLHMGQYREAHTDARRGRALALETRHQWGVAFSCFVEGLAALALGRAQEAVASLQHSIAIFEEVRHRENQGWVAGPLGLAALGAGNPEMARDCVLQALQIGLELEAFMPLMYGLPVAALLLRDGGQVESALEVYACVSRYPFVAGSRWFEDRTATLMSDAATALPPEVIEEAQGRGRGRELAGVARDAMARLDPTAG